MPERVNKYIGNRVDPPIRSMISDLSTSTLMIYLKYCDKEKPSY